MSAPLDVRFFVPGTPVPKGNHDAFPISRGDCEDCKRKKPCRRRNCFRGIIVGTVVTDSKGKELEAWQQFVGVHAASARNAAGARMVEAPGALEVRMVFLFERPAGHWTSKGALSADGQRRPLPTVKPDCDKVSRATADALTGVLAADDAQIVTSMVAKVYADGRPGVLIRAREVSAPDAWVLAELKAAGIRSSFELQGGLFG